jgi:hypothetical protein
MSATLALALWTKDPFLNERGVEPHRPFRSPGR